MLPYLEERQALQPWEQYPCRLVSWFDVLYFSANAFFWCGRTLTGIKSDCLVGAMVCVNNEAGVSLATDLDDQGREKAIIGLQTVDAEFRKINLTITADTVHDLIDELNNKGRRSFEWLLTHIEAIERLAVKELRGKLFVYIPPERSKFWPLKSQPNLFGVEVATDFPSASFDIENAGLCLATSTATASVFHLWKALPDCKEQQEFFAQAASHFGIIKDAWRNYTMHARGKYTPDEAERIFDSVRGFMQKLAGRLKE